MLFKAYPDQQKDYRVVVVTLTVVATILLVCKLLTSFRIRGQFGWEVIFVAIANVFLIIQAGFMYKATTYGFGMQVARIKATGGDVQKAMFWFWLSQPVYILASGFNKLSFVALYHRVFYPEKRIRCACLLLGFICVGWTITYVCLSFFACTPIPRVYDRTIAGTCIDAFSQRWSNAISNLLTDILIFLLPIPGIIRLNMSRVARVGLILVFSMGFFICLITALRMATLPLTLKTKQPTYESAPTNMWSFIEVAVGVICACLITMRKAFSMLWPNQWRTFRDTTARLSLYSSGWRRGQLSATNDNGEGHVLEGLKFANVSNCAIESQEYIIKGGDASQIIKVTTDVEVVSK